MFVNINPKLDCLTLSVGDQLAFNKKIELKVAQLASAAKVVKLTEECSTAILNELSKKKQDPACPTISCSIGAQQFDHTLCDLGASVSVMPKSVFDRLNFTNLEPTTMTL